MDLRLDKIPVGVITAGLIDCLREHCELLRNCIRIIAELISFRKLLWAGELRAEFGPYDCMKICCSKFPMDLRLDEIPVGVITAGLIDCLREYREYFGIA